MPVLRSVAIVQHVRSATQATLTLQYSAPTWPQEVLPPRRPCRLQPPQADRPSWPSSELRLQRDLLITGQHSHRGQKRRTGFIPAFRAGGRFFPWTLPGAAACPSSAGSGTMLPPAPAFLFAAGRFLPLFCRSRRCRSRSSFFRNFSSSFLRLSSRRISAFRSRSACCCCFFCRCASSRSRFCCAFRAWSS